MSAVRDELDLEEKLRRPARGEPVWLLAKRFPLQGRWTPAEYLTLATDRGVEYADGCLEFLPVPTEYHQWIAGALYRRLYSVVADHGIGRVYQAGYRIRVQGRFREPDVVCILKENANAIGRQFANASDLVVEVVSDDDPDRDLIDKRAEYAAAGISEYWIADPRDKSLTILALDADTTEYREAGRYREGETARSILVDGLAVDVTAVFATE